jgi:hypothetical protein
VRWDDDWWANPAQMLDVWDLPPIFVVVSYRSQWCTVRLLL